MGNSFDRWDDVAAGNARLAELTELHKLTALEVCISSVQETLFPENLERFKIFIGIGWTGHWEMNRWVSYSWESSFESSKIMKVKLQGASIKSNDSIKKLLKKTEELYLEGLNGVENLVYELNDEGFQHLKCLQVQHAPDITHICNPAGSLALPSHEFPILEELTLYKLQKMKKICGGLTGAATFKELRKITVSCCDQLKNLFSFSMARQLQRLQEIEVRCCDSIEQIIDDVEEQGNGNDIVEESERCKPGNSLRSLELRSLPKLIGFNSNCSDISLFNDKIVFPNLEELELSRIKINQLWITSSCVENPQETLNFKRLKRLRMLNCSSLEYLFTPSMVSGLGQLKDLHVSHCKDLKQVIMVKGVEEVVNTELIFPQLNSISLWFCDKLSSFYVGSSALKFQSAIKIEIRRCPNMITFASKSSTKKEKEKETAYRESNQGRCGEKEPNICGQTLFFDAVEIPLFDDLYLGSICVQQIWHSQITPTSSFNQNLRKLTVMECNNLEYLFTSLTVKIFEQLEVLQIRGCEGMQVVILTEELVEKERTSQTLFPTPDTLEPYDFPKSGNTDVKDVIMFRQLKSLKLDNLPELSSFCAGKCDFELPSLKEVIVIGCPQMKYFSMGKIVTKKLRNVQCIDDEEKGHWAGDLNRTIQDLFTQKVGCLLESGKLQLSKFSELIEIWKKNPEKLTLLFENLQHLEVCNCNNLSYLLTPSMALALVQLKGLEIKDCAAMEQVNMVTGVKEVVGTDLTFPRLESISLESCSKLSSFYVGSNTLKFPSLEKIIVKNCSAMVRFASKFSSIQDKETIDGRSEQTLVKEETDIFTGPFFCDEVEIPILKTLTLFSINIKQIWNSQLSSISLFAQHLTKLKVVNCCYLKYLLTFSMVECFAQLKKLRISGCEMMEVVILIEGVAKEEQICQTVFPNLKTLVLNDLPQLSTFCSNCDFLGEISNSKRVDIGTRSQELLATQSTLVETKATKVVFSQVTCLVLRLLPKFKNFFPETDITEWPSLERLAVMQCHGMQLVASEFSSTEMTGRDNQLEGESQHLKFWINKATFPSLKYLAVKWNDNMKIRCGPHPEEYFGSLEVLKLIGFPKQSAFLRPFFFQSLPSLAKLAVEDAFVSEIFQNEEDTTEEKPVRVRTPLNKVKLSKLHELTHLWKEESQHEAEILDNLTALKVQECSRLKNLVPSIVHFDNLQTLVVSDCHGLVNLMRYSTAKSLGQLKGMKVANCEMIEEIVICLGDAMKDDGIVFPNLRRLQLKGLPRLESFCSENCNFQFPALFGAIVTKCPNMQIFSKGELRTPRLHEVKLTGDIYEDMDSDIDKDMEKEIDDIFHDDEVEDESCWKGNLNSTIQHLFEEKSARNSKRSNGENNDHDVKEDGN